MRDAPQSPSFDARVRAAWQTPLAAAGTLPGLVPALVPPRHALHSRFTAYHTQLRALPRRVRRALQRQWRLPLAGIALMLALGQSPAWRPRSRWVAPVRWWTPSPRPTPTRPRAGVRRGVGPTRLCCRRAARRR